jgi:hypothetical protein
VYLGNAKRCAREPFAEILHVLPDEVTRGRDQANIAFFFDHGVDRDAQHDFGFARARRCLQQELEDVVVEARADRVDRYSLIVGEREGFTGLDEFVGDRDRLGVAVDRRPDLGF